MKPGPAWRRYLRFFGHDVDADIRDELRFHLEQRIADYEQLGMTRPEAERAAHARLGDLDVVGAQLEQHDRAQLRRGNRREHMTRILDDVRFALRGFRRAPAFFATAVAILAIGIGTSVAMFTVFRTVLVRRLPVIDQDRIVVMWTYASDPNTDFVTGTKDLSVVRRESRTMRDMAAVSHTAAIAYPFVYANHPIELNRGMVTGNFFDLLGAQPALGRLFRPSDDEPPGASLIDPRVARTIVLSYRGWREKFGGDSSVVGRQLFDPLSRNKYTIIGVAPAGLEYPAGVEYWVPMWFGWQSMTSAFAVARLAPGATVRNARDEYLAIEQRLEPKAFSGAHAATFTETVVGNVRPVLTLLTSAVALLLLSASSRAREIAIRRALGAGFLDIVRQFMTEALIIAVAAGGAGLGLAIAALRLLIAYAPAYLPRMDQMQLNGAPIGIAVAVASVAVLLFGIAPAVIAARSKHASPLRSSARTGAETRRRRHMRQALVAFQIALAMVMLGSAALLARSLAELQGQDTGFVSDHLSVISYTWNARRDTSGAQLVALGGRVLDRVRSISPVISATQIVVPPLLGNGVWQLRFQMEGQNASDAEKNLAIPAELCGPGFFKTFGVPLLRGRAFTDHDGSSDPLVAIVSESVARRFWPSVDPIGKRIRFAGMKPADLVGGDGWRTIVGVAHDTHLRTFREASPILYLPSLQSDWQGYVAIRSATPLPALLPALRAAGRDVDPDLVLWAPETMDQILAQPLAQPRLGTLLMSSFGIVALLLAAIGLFGVMASIVRDQTRELGIRIALGATAGRVRMDVLRGAGIVAGIGAIVGLLGALLASRLFSALLFHVSPTDPFALSGACVVLLGTASVAAYLPARRATQVDPAVALRAE